MHLSFLFVFGFSYEFVFVMRFSRWGVCCGRHHVSDVWIRDPLWIPIQCNTLQYYAISLWIPPDHQYNVCNTLQYYSISLWIPPKHQYNAISCNTIQYNVISLWITPDPLFVPSITLYLQLFKQWKHMGLYIKIFFFSNSWQWYWHFLTMSSERITLLSNLL